MNQFMNKAVTFSVIILVALTGTTTHAFYSDVTTNMTTVNHRGTCESVGLWNLTFNQDSFAAASPSDPLYIRIIFDKGATLCQTLVWDNDANPDNGTRDPIQIPISVLVEGSQPDLQVVAPSDSVAIVRWKAGENQIWLRVSQASTNWLSNGVISDDARVVFGIGTTAEADTRYHDYFMAKGHANLLGSTRVGSSEVLDTTIKLDLSESTLQQGPSDEEVQTILNINLITFASGHSNDAESPEHAVEASDIVFGNLVTPAFSADNPLAKGWLPTRTQGLLERAPSWQTGTVTLLEMVAYLNQEFPYEACELNLTP